MISGYLIYQTFHFFEFPKKVIKFEKLTFFKQDFFQKIFEFDTTK